MNNDETNLHLVVPTRRNLLQLLAASAAVAYGPSMAQAGEPIKIGAVLSLTGPGAGLGVPERSGVLLAEKAINQAGGVRGRQVKVILEDDGSKPDLAKSKAERLIFEEKVIALIGGSLTASTGSMAAITNAEKMAQICFTGLGPKIELDYKSLFHAVPPQSLNARAMLEYATKGAKAKKIGVLHDTGYGQAVMAALQVEKAGYGVDFVAVERFEVGATDVSAQAAKVRASNPEIVFVISTSAVPFRNARQMKISQTIVAGLGSASYDYVRAMGEFGDAIVFPEFVVAEDPVARQNQFVALYKKENNNAMPKNFEASGWDAMHMIARAVEKAGPTASREAVAAAMRAPYEGVMARYDFSAPDMTGIALGSYVYSQLVKGQFTRLPFTASN
ncbi:ABC transporter substrate-binding protein [Variovorax sp. GB1P17]|uniref:ABC transporter substrate-binding protein n=1 Tax=Variovorax sp. GB1P17 TaxID=3443740 RepID=UPI003F468A67